MVKENGNNIVVTAGTYNIRINFSIPDALVYTLTK
jgi:hypothetical protein